MTGMKVHKLTIIVIDFDELGADEVKTTIENQRFPNDCIYPSVESIETRDCGKWSDEHPLNNSKTKAAEIERLFA
jgi:hypothetical protein